MQAGIAVNHISRQRIKITDFEEKLYKGIEDIRIFTDIEDPNKLVYMGTSQHQNGTIGMLYGTYAPFYDYIISKLLLY